VEAVKQIVRSELKVSYVIGFRKYFNEVRRKRVIFGVPPNSELNKRERRPTRAKSQDEKNAAGTKPRE